MGPCSILLGNAKPRAGLQQASTSSVWNHSNSNEPFPMMLPFDKPTVPMKQQVVEYPDITRVFNMPAGTFGIRIVRKQNSNKFVAIGRVRKTVSKPKECRSMPAERFRVTRNVLRDRLGARTAPKMVVRSKVLAMFRKGSKFGAIQSFPKPRDTPTNLLQQETTTTVISKVPVDETISGSVGVSVPEGFAGFLVEFWHAWLQESQKWNDFDNKVLALVDPSIIKTSIIKTSIIKLSLDDKVSEKTALLSAPTASGSYRTTASNNDSTAIVVFQQPAKELYTEAAPFRLEDFVSNRAFLTRLIKLGCSPYLAMEYWTVPFIPRYSLAQYKIPPHMRRGPEWRPHETLITPKYGYFMRRINELRDTYFGKDDYGRDYQYLSPYIRGTAVAFYPNRDGSVTLKVGPKVGCRMMGHQDYKNWAKVYGSMRITESSMRYREYRKPAKFVNYVGLAQQAIESGFDIDCPHLFAFGSRFRFKPFDREQSVWTALHIPRILARLLKLAPQSEFLCDLLEQWRNRELWQPWYNGETVGDILDAAGYVPPAFEAVVESVLEPVAEPAAETVAEPVVEPANQNVTSEPVPGSRASLSYFQERKRIWEAAKATRRRISELSPPRWSSSNMPPRWSSSKKPVVTA